jgi:hypothetical protein
VSATLEFPFFTLTCTTLQNKNKKIRQKSIRESGTQCQKERKKQDKTTRYALEWTVVSLLNEPSLERVREHKLLTSQASILKKETRAIAVCQKRGITPRARFSEHTHGTISWSVVGHTAYLQSHRAKEDTSAN